MVKLLDQSLSGLCSPEGAGPLVQRTEVGVSATKSVATRSAVLGANKLSVVIRTSSSAPAENHG
jgi:hypothetical protein